MTELTTQERFKRGAADAGPFFRYIAHFVGFTAADAAVIRESRFIIEKYLPSIIADFYTQLLRFPATRRLFLHPDGSVDQDYLALRMHHQANFWRRAASGVYDDDFARYIDYVGRAHTSQGADPRIYIPERYVIGMVGFVQQRVSEALHKELRDVDVEMERRAAKAWNLLLIVVLELLSRSYGREREQARFEAEADVDAEAMFRLSLETYERALGIAREIQQREIFVAPPEAIAEGERKIVAVDGLSIGVFRHKGQWLALSNSCLHRGGPVCAGKVEGDVITCPWHGYQYDLPTGELLLDRDTRLPKYAVEVRDDGIYVIVPVLIREELEIALDPFDVPGETEALAPELAENEFLPAELAPGEVSLVHVDGEPVAIYNVDGTFYATHAHCTHVGGPLNQGRLDGHLIICPWHDSCFDVRSGAVACGPATAPVQPYRVTHHGEIARVEVQEPVAASVTHANDGKIKNSAGAATIS